MLPPHAADPGAELALLRLGGRLEHAAEQAHRVVGGVPRALAWAANLSVLLAGVMFVVYGFLFAFPDDEEGGVSDASDAARRSCVRLGAFGGWTAAAVAPPGRRGPLAG